VPFNGSVVNGAPFNGAAAGPARASGARRTPGGLNGHAVNGRVLNGGWDAAEFTTDAADLVQAIVDYLQADALVAATLPGGLWMGEAPPGAAMPVAVVMLVADEPESTGLDDYGSHAEVQVSVFAGPKRRDALAAGEVVRNSLLPRQGMDLLEWQDGQETGRTVGPIYVEHDPDPGPDGGDVWHCRFTLNVGCAHEVEAL
jgi:hypothetical protein